METINIKGKLEEDRKINGELVIRTDNNVPYPTGKTIVISEDVVKHYQELYDQDEDYFKTTNISYIRVLKVADYVARTLRGFEEKGGFEGALPIDTVIDYESTLRFIESANTIMDMEEQGRIVNESRRLNLN